MEPLWSPVVAIGGKRRQIDQRLKLQKQATSVATSCHRLRAAFHGKQSVCRGLPPLAEVPSLRGRRSISVGISERDYFSAVRAWALVAAAAGACLAPQRIAGIVCVPLLGRPLGRDGRTAARAEVRVTRDLRPAGVQTAMRGLSLKQRRHSAPPLGRGADRF